MTCTLCNEIFIACDFRNDFRWYFDLKWNLEYLNWKTQWWNNGFVFCWPWICKESWWCLDGSATQFKKLRTRKYVFMNIVSMGKYFLIIHWTCRFMRHTFSTINWYKFRYIVMKIKTYVFLFKTKKYLWFGFKIW